VTLHAADECGTRSGARHLESEDDAFEAVMPNVFAKVHAEPARHRQ